MPSKEDVDQYYEAYLLKLYPTLTSQEREERLQEDLSNHYIVDYITAMFEMDLELREEYPGWTTWFDHLKRIP